MVENEILNSATKYANAVKKKYENSRIYLFGSQIKGNNNKDSDIDIAVVLKHFETKLDIQFELMRLRRNIDSRIEPHPFREVEFVSSDILANEVLLNGMKITN